MKSNTPGDGSWAFQGTYLEEVAETMQNQHTQWIHVQPMFMEIRVYSTIAYVKVKVGEKGNPDKQYIYMNTTHMLVLNKIKCPKFP